MTAPGTATRGRRRRRDHAPTRGSAVPSAEATGPYRCGVVALVGRTNAGKSTLLNRMIGTKVAIVSESPQTTRHRIRGVLTRPHGQVVFVDTPGIHRPRYRMNERMMAATRRTLREVDVVALIVDASEPPGPGVVYTLGLLEGVGAPVVLLLNKIDRVPKPRLLPLIDRFRRQYPFAEIIPISALRGDNCDRFEEALFRYLPEGPALFPPDAVTDRPVRFLVAELIREQLLRRTRGELPYTTAVAIEGWEEPAEEGGVVRVLAMILVDQPSHKPIVIGRGGRMLKAVGTAARQRIQELVGRRVHLELHVKVRPGWRQKPAVLDELEIES